MAILINKTLRVEFPVESSAVVGRAPDADLQLNFPTVSKKHMRLFETNGIWVVEDLGSANSTYVNGERITRKELSAGDYIRLDAYTLVFFVNVPPLLPEIIVQDPGSVIRQRLPISQPLLRIGRSLQENHIPIDDPSVSGRHLNLVRIGSQWKIEFAKPSVHVRVNENLILDGTIVNTTDKIRIGSTLIEINVATPKEWTIISQVNTRLTELFADIRKQGEGLESTFQQIPDQGNDWIKKIKDSFTLIQDSLKLLEELSTSVHEMVPSMEDLEVDGNILEQGIRLSRRCNNLANYLELVLLNNQLENIKTAKAEDQQDLVSRFFRNVHGCLENDNPTIRL
jgi:pSer/pThr/pTyr-binding forkhead associated (FHA) protein